MDSRVLGSLIFGSRINSLGLMVKSANKRSLVFLALVNLKSAFRTPLPRPMGMSDALSAPPAIALSIIPKAILLATLNAACMLVTQAWEIS